MDKLKVQVVLETIKQETGIYIQRNDIDEFLKKVWKILATEVPALKESVDLFYTPGFKTNRQQKLVEKFATAKQSFDKFMTVFFKAAVLDSEAGYQVMAGKFAEIARENNW